MKIDLVGATGTARTHRLRPGRPSETACGIKLAGKNTQPATKEARCWNCFPARTR